MSEYYSKEVLILNNTYSTTIPDLISRAEIVVDYGVFPQADSGIAYNGQVDYLVNSNKNKITYSFVLVNSTQSPPPLTVSWSYDRTGNYADWKNLDYADPIWTGSGNNPFTTEINYVQNGNEITYTCSLIIDQDVSLNDWKSLVVKFQVDPYQEGNGIIWNTPTSLARFFIYNYGSPPSGIYFNTNLENTALGDGATLSTDVFTWETITNAVWEYSDDNKVTWLEADNTVGNPSVASSMGMLEGNELNQSIPSFTNRDDHIAVDVSRFVEDRFYRLKITTTN